MEWFTSLYSVVDSVGRELHPQFEDSLTPLTPEDRSKRGMTPKRKRTLGDKSVCEKH
jgi:hypothetical protein